MSLLTTAIIVCCTFTTDVDLTTVKVEESPASIRLNYSDFQDEEALVPFNLSVMQEDQPVARYGEKDSTRLTFQGAVATASRSNFLYFAGVGFEHFIAEDISLVTQFNGVYADQVGENAWGANFVLLFRWHFYAQSNWSAFLEAGAGAVYFSHHVPARGSEFNFTPQAALGMTFEIGNDYRGVVAAGWHHISNAQLSEDNPGRDSFILHFGISMPF